MIKPSLPKRLFWDWKYDEIDWQNGYRSIIARVIERGTKEEWEEIINFYGRKKVVNTLKNEIKYLPDYAVDDICEYFGLEKETLISYTRKQSRQGHWI